MVIAASRLFKIGWSKSRLQNAAAAKEATPNSTSQAAFKAPEEQWVDYIEKCAHVSGKWDSNRRANTEEALSRAHKTTERIFPNDKTGASAARAPDAPIVDSHGLWVGSSVEDKLKDAAGASSAAMWQKKAEIKSDVAKKTSAPALAAVGAFATGATEGAYRAENPNAAAMPTDVAGASSAQLCKVQREMHGMMTDGLAAGRAEPREGADAARAGSPVGKVAGLTSADCYMANQGKRSKSPAPTRTQVHAHAAGSAGLTSSQTGERAVQDFANARLESGPPAVRAEMAVRDYTSEIAISGAESSKLGAEANHVMRGSDAKASEVASAAPAKCWDGAAGMNSAQVRRAKTGTERRHGSPLLGHGERDTLHLGRLERDIGGTIEAGGTAEGARAPLAVSVAPSAEPYAGARSSHLNRPSTAYEARHLWSETAPRERPQGSFGARVPLAAAGGAGLTSDQLASTTLAFEAAHKPMLRKTPSPVASGPSAGGAGVCSAALALSKTELTFDRTKPLRKTEATMQGLSATQKSAAAGASSKAIGDHAVASLSLDLGDVKATKIPLGELSLTAAHLNSPQRAPGGAHDGARRPHSAGKAPGTAARFHDAAGVSAAALAKREAKKEYVADEVRAETLGRPSNPWVGSVSGVAATVFGGDDAAAAAVAASAEFTAGRKAQADPRLLDGRMGMASGDIALGRCVSRGAHEHHLAGVAARPRAASEPRRRPSAAEGSNAAALIFPNHADEPQQHAARAASPAALRKQSAAAAAAEGVTAGATSSHLSSNNRESRRSVGGGRVGTISSLGGYMTGPMLADWDAAPSAAPARQYTLSGQSYEPRAASPSRGFRAGSPMALRMEQRVAAASPAASSSMSAAMAGGLSTALTVGSPAAARAGGRGGGQYSPHRNVASTRPW